MSPLDHTGPVAAAASDAPAPTSSTRLPALFAALPTLFWASNFLVARAMRDQIPPVQISLWRWVLAFVLLAPFAWGRAAEEGSVPPGAASWLAHSSSCPGSPW